MTARHEAAARHSGRKWFRVIGFLAVVFLGCEGAQVTLRDKDGKHSLTYKCAAYKHQAESVDDLALLATSLAESMVDAVEHERVASVQALKAAYDGREWLAIERALVEYRCANPPKSAP